MPLSHEDARKLVEAIDGTMNFSHEISLEAFVRELEERFSEADWVALLAEAGVELWKEDRA